MILNKKYFALSALALLATMFAACSDDDPSEVYVGDMPQYQKAYITTGVSAPNGSAFRGSFSGEVQLNEEGKLVYVVSEDMRPATSFDSDVYFRTNFAVKKTVSGNIAVVPDTEEFVAQYNAEHKTEYKLLPAEYYTVGDGHVTIEAGSKSSATAVHVAVDTELKWEVGEYMLPLGLTLDSGAEIELAENQSTICLKYSITKDNIRILSRDEFEMDPNSSANAERVLDSDRSTIWGNYAEDYLYVTFKEPQYVSSVILVDCTYAYFRWMSYEDTPDDMFGGSYDWGNSPGLTTFNPAAISYDATRKAKRVVICNYYGTIADVYFLVHD